MPRIAFLEVGRVHDCVMQQLGFDNVDTVPITTVFTLNFHKYDIVVVPYAYNQDVLHKLRSRIASFVKHGGLFIAFGASNDKSLWLSFCTYSSPFVKDIIFRNQETDEFRDIFRDIPAIPESVQFHDWGISHGSFTCSSEGCLPLISGEHTNDCVMAIIQLPRSTGKYFITTIDPCYHSVVGYTFHGQKTILHAQRLFRNIIEWAVKQTYNQTSLAIWYRRLIGILKSILSAKVIYLGMLLIFMSFIGYIADILSVNVFTAITGAASIISLLISVWRKRRE
ncbi:MAG: hypothetical protein ACLQVJ_10155 [Syntrophobacteraceae bacterium]